MAEREKKPQIQAGCRVGSLTVAAPTAERKSGYMVWRCVCDCGGEIFLDTRCLQRGTVRDCGCKTAVGPGKKDLTGQRFGMLICLEPTDQRGNGGGVMWRCRCDCGKECLADSAQLLRGYKKSCGCLSRPPVENLVGKRFGMLTVLEYAGKENRVHLWRCRCDCGRETVVRHGYLVSGHTKSCGCLRKEQMVENLCLADGTSAAILEATKNRLIASNTSGYNGVYRNRKREKWTAQITFKGKTYYLGSYDKIEDAVKARLRGEEMYDDFLQWYYAEYPEKKAGTSKIYTERKKAQRP